MAIEIETTDLMHEAIPVEAGAAPVFSGIPGGESLGKSSLGGWALIDVDGDEIGHGPDPEGALMSRYRLGVARRIAREFEIFNAKMEGGENV